MKKYILIAGVNGAGKSTLYQSLQSLQSMPRVNSDEILREFGDWRDMADVMTAGKIAVKKIARYFDNLKTVLPECDLAAFYDNAIEFRRFAIYKHGKPIRVSQEIPLWYEKFIENLK